jgi:DNA processing protein
MALGIDAAAHQGALQAPRSDHACTVAVLGTGLDVIYPRRHAALAQQIAAHGLLLSEYPLGTPPLPPNFPKRNRLISGLSAGTLVVEAALASGSLITARMAAEQGREVFAIPGSIHAPQSKGCHALLRQGAKLVETVQDMLDELQPWPNAATPAPAQTAATPTATTAEHPLLAALGFDPMGLDQLQALTGWDTAALQAWLLEQELDGQVARLPGGLFQRLVRS